MAEVAILLKYDVASLGNWLLVFQNNIVVPLSSSEMCNFFFDISTLDYKTINVVSKRRESIMQRRSALSQNSGNLTEDTYLLTYSMEKSPS